MTLTAGEPLKILRVLLAFAVLGLGSILVADSFQDFSKNFTVAVVLESCLVGWFVLSLFPRFYRVTVHGFISTVLLLISLNFLYEIGSHDLSSPAYLVIILLAAFFLGKRGTAVYTVLTLVASSAVILLDLARVVPSGYPTTLETLAVFVVTNGAGGVLVWLLLDKLDQSLGAEKTSADEVRLLNESLEKRVEDRTKALYDAHEKLSRNEKQAVLGRLASNLIHEINSPLGALVSGAASLGLSHVRFRQNFRRFTALGAPADYALFTSLAFARRQSLGAVSGKHLGPLADRLEDLGASEPAELAECLIEMGFGEAGALPEALADRRITPEAEAAVRSADDFLALDRLAVLIGESSDRIHKTVESLRSYVDLPGDQEAFSRIDLGESVSSAVKLLAGTLGTPISVTVECPPGAAVLGQPDRLFLVWSQLLKACAQTAALGGEILVRFTPAANGKEWTGEFRAEGNGAGPGDEVAATVDYALKVLNRHGGGLRQTNGPGTVSYVLVLPRV